MRFHIPAFVLLASLSVLPVSAPAVAVPSAQDSAPVISSDASSSLVRWQLALDQIAQNHFTEARVLLESARLKSGDAAEINMLLAYIAEREGRDAAAFLAPIRETSSLAAAWNAQKSAPLSSSISAPKSAAQKISATLRQPDARLEALEKNLANRVNTERVRLGFRPLSYDSLLADTARAHSGEMRDLKYFAHESPTPVLAEPLDRYRAAFNRTPLLVAENIYRSWGGVRVVMEKDIITAHEALMKSPGHRTNILLPDAARIGIGLTINANGDLWITQMFSRG